MHYFFPQSDLQFHAKNHRLQSMLCFLSLFFLMSFNLAGAQTKIPDNNTAENTKRLNTTLRLMTHNQRVVKLYYQAVLNVEADQARGKMNESMTLISSHLDKLHSSNLSGPALTYLKESDAAWSAMIRQISSTPSKSGAELLQVNNTKFIDNIENLIIELSKSKRSSNSDIAVLVNKQVALSQRIARNYFAFHIGITSRSTKERLLELLKRFNSVQEELEAFAGSNAKLKEDLDLIKVQLIFFRTILERADTSNKSDIPGMAKVSGRLLEVLSRIEQEFSK